MLKLNSMINGSILSFQGFTVGRIFSVIAKQPINHHSEYIW
uniref:Uncharacterized protein n=1 Tax=Anguilla anguilla TaxID=7936 RepID=A0A0E9PUZ0_ANGAN